MLQVKNISSQNSYKSNCFLVTSGNTSCVIDPSMPIDVLSKEEQETIQFVLLTHAHYDHMCEIDSYLEKGIPVYASHLACKGSLEPEHNVSLMFGRSCSFDGLTELSYTNSNLMLFDQRVIILSTPGHTDCSLSFLIGKHLFSGDLIFADGGYGRYDLPSGNHTQLRESILKILALDASITIHPGHGIDTTIEQEKKYYI